MNKPQHKDQTACPAHRLAESEPGDGRQAATRVQRFAWSVLILMALLALGGLALDLSNYVQAVNSAHGLSLTILSVELMDDHNPRALVRFRVRNDAPLEIDLVRYAFELVHNDERAGSSISTYTGTGKSKDTVVLSDAAKIDRALAPGQYVDLEFTLFIHSSRMDSIRQALGTAPSHWRADTEFTAVLPYSRQETAILLRAELEE